uniref:Apple domain-containing protein n=1 Tax=Macrostomum lignano TaxID=282301 RepID=A0A1I8H3Z5_9PLAT
AGQPEGGDEEQTPDDVADPGKVEGHLLAEVQPDEADGLEAAAAVPGFPQAQPQVQSGLACHGGLGLDRVTERAQAEAAAAAGAAGAALGFCPSFVVHGEGVSKDVRLEQVLQAFTGAAAVAAALLLAAEELVRPHAAHPGPQLRADVDVLQDGVDSLSPGQRNAIAGICQVLDDFAWHVFIWQSRARDLLFWPAVEQKAGLQLASSSTWSGGFVSSTPSVSRPEQQPPQATKLLTDVLCRVNRSPHGCGASAPGLRAQLEVATRPVLGLAAPVLGEGAHRGIVQCELRHPIVLLHGCSARVPLPCRLCCHSGRNHAGKNRNGSHEKKLSAVSGATGKSSSFSVTRQHRKPQRRLDDAAYALTLSSQCKPTAQKVIKNPSRTRGIPHRHGTVRMLTELLLLTLFTAGDSLCPNRTVFTHRLIRFCLKPQFLFEPSYPARSEKLCALFCVERGDRCRGFRLTTESASGCQTFEFDRCSHRVNQNSPCTRSEWAFVRQQPGLPEGQLCPAGFANGFSGSVYKMVGVSSWTDGLNKCNSEPGLVKFADAGDRPEVEHIGTFKSTLNGDLSSWMRSFYLGGYRPSPLSSGTWYWRDCNATIQPEAWGSGEPNENGLHNRTNIWYGYSSSFGLDDEVESGASWVRALCECTGLAKFAHEIDRPEVDHMHTLRNFSNVDLSFTMRDFYIGCYRPHEGDSHNRNVFTHPIFGRDCIEAKYVSRFVFIKSCKRCAADCNLLSCLHNDGWTLQTVFVRQVQHEGVRKCSCNRVAKLYVRRQPGLRPGALCPADFHLERAPLQPESMSYWTVLLFCLLASWSAAVAELSVQQFTKHFIRLCLRPEFLRNTPLADPSNIECGMVCLNRGVRCRGFRLTGDDGSVCQTMEFDRCSHMPNEAGCDRSGWAFVRSLEGLPNGRLCPADFANGYRSSVYKMVDVSSWTDGLNKCNSEPGLAKFADGIDRLEVDHMHTLKNISNVDLVYWKRSFYLGGYRPSPLSSGTWYWHDCNATLAPEVWSIGQPNQGDSYDRINVWHGHPYGVDDEVESSSYLIRALCECIDPNLLDGRVPVLCYRPDHYPDYHSERAKDGVSQLAGLTSDSERGIASGDLISPSLLHRLILASPSNKKDTRLTLFLRVTAVAAAGVGMPPLEQTDEGRVSQRDSAGHCGRKTSSWRSLNWLVLDLSMLLLLYLLGSSCSAAAELSTQQFTKHFIRLCLRPEFLHNTPLARPSNVKCSVICINRGVRCRGFRLTGDDGSVCQTMEFDRCSHMPNEAGCDRSGWAFVRSLEGLPNGRLCPADFANGYRSSVYKMVGVSSWTDGLNKCNSEPGLAKFADGIDRPEVEHIRTLMPILNKDLSSSKRSFYLGGYRPSPLSSGTWYWRDCNIAIKPEAWGSGQPNEGAEHNRVDIWFDHDYGLDDEEESLPSRLIRALCECLNPTAGDSCISAMSSSSGLMRPSIRPQLDRAGKARKQHMVPATAVLQSAARNAMAALDGSFRHRLRVEDSRNMMILLFKGAHSRILRLLECALEQAVTMQLKRYMKPCKAPGFVEKLQLTVNTMNMMRRFLTLGSIPFTCRELLVKARIAPVLKTPAWLSMSCRRFHTPTPGAGCGTARRCQTTRRFESRQRSMSRVMSTASGVTMVFSRYSSIRTSRLFSFVRLRSLARCRAAADAFPLVALLPGSSHFSAPSSCTSCRSSASTIRSSASRVHIQQAEAVNVEIFEFATAICTKQELCNSLGLKSEEHRWMGSACLPHKGDVEQRSEVVGAAQGEGFHGVGGLVVAVELPSPTHRVEIPFLRREPGPALLSEAELVDAPSVAQVGLELLPVARVGQAGAGEHAAERDGEVVLEHQPDELHQLDQAVHKEGQPDHCERHQAADVVAQPRVVEGQPLAKVQPDVAQRLETTAAVPGSMEPPTKAASSIPLWSAASRGSGTELGQLLRARRVFGTDGCIVAAAAASAQAAAAGARLPVPGGSQPVRLGIFVHGEAVGEDSRVQQRALQSCDCLTDRLVPYDAALEPAAVDAVNCAQLRARVRTEDAAQLLAHVHPVQQGVNPLSLSQCDRDTSRRRLLGLQAVLESVGGGCVRLLQQRSGGPAEEHVPLRVHEWSRDEICPKADGCSWSQSPSAASAEQQAEPQPQCSTSRSPRESQLHELSLGHERSVRCPEGPVESPIGGLAGAATPSSSASILRSGRSSPTKVHRVLFYRQAPLGGHLLEDAPAGVLQSAAAVLQEAAHLGVEQDIVRVGPKNRLAMPAVCRNLCALILSCFICSALCHQFRASDLGCFVDSATERDVRGLKYLGLTRVGGHGMEQTNISSAYGLVHSTQMTHELCGFRYMALQAATWCGCDNSYGSHGAAPSGDCWHACAGTAVHTGIKREPFIVLGDRDLVAMSSPDSRRFLDRQRSWTRRVRRPVRHRLSVGDLQPAAAPVPPAGVCMLQSRPPSEAPAAATSSSDFVSILHLLLTLDNKELNSKHGFLGPGCCGLQPSRGNGHAFRPADAGESKTSLAVFLLWGGDSWPLGRNTAPLLRRIASQGRKIDLHAGRRDSDAGADSLLVDPSERQLNTHCFIDLDTSSKKTLITVRYELSAGGASRTFEACVLLGCTAGFLRVLRHQILDMRNTVFSVHDDGISMEFPRLFRLPAYTNCGPASGFGVVIVAQQGHSAWYHRFLSCILPALISVLPNNVLLQAGENSRFDFVIRTLGPIDKAQRCSDHLKDDEEDQPVGVRCGHAVNAETLRREGQDRPGGEDAGEAEEVEQPVPDADARSRQRHGPAVQEQQPLRVQPQVDGHGDEGHRGRQVEGGAEHLRGFENFPGISSPGLESPGLEGPGLETPGLEGPDLESPGLEIPGLETPGLEGPGLEIPGLETPGLESPGLETPGLEGPGLESPGLETPGLESPGLESPGLESPGLETPGRCAPCESLRVSRTGLTACQAQRELTVMNPYRMTFSRYSSSSISCSLDLTRCRCSANASLPLGLVSPSLAMWLRSSSARISSSTDAILYSRPHDVGTAFEQRLAHHVAGGGDVQQVEAVDRCVGEGARIAEAPDFDAALDVGRPHLPHEGDIEQWSIVVGKAEGEGLDGE